ncbi:unnamed protein product [Rodentolepis nana]|uniref:Flagellin n=1 Tax=Rodentolepis nana TaxID=102285 RepID=A0A0R3TIU6_RODNA|nr:unnamed protein product [Rodentolepis nana]
MNQGRDDSSDLEIGEMMASAQSSLNTVTRIRDKVDNLNGDDYNAAVAT